MKKRTLWRNLGFLAVWLIIGGFAIYQFAPNLLTSRNAAPNTAAVPPASDVPPLDEAPAPHFYFTETATAGCAAPAVDRTNDNIPVSDSCFALSGAVAPAAAPSELADSPPWQTDTTLAPGAAARESEPPYGPSLVTGGAAPDLPGAPAPDEPAEVTSTPGIGGIGEGDAIEDPSEIASDSNSPGSLGLSGIGAGGGGSGDGIGLGTIGHGAAGDRPDLGEIGNLKSGGGSGRGFGYGSANTTAAAQPTTRSIEVAAAPTPTERTADDPMSEVDRKLAALPLGNIAFNTPETIPLGDTATIELLVSMKEAEEELRQQVHGIGGVETAHVQLSDQMEAKVTGLGFHIEPITPERQAVSQTQETRWRWQIEPAKSDTLELNLTLSALIKIDGEPSARAIRTFEKTIVVKVPFGQHVVTAMSNNIELLTSVVLIPVAGGTWRYFRKRKRGKVLPNDDAVAPRQAA
jgi:hypothetical protein